MTRQKAEQQNVGNFKGRGSVMVLMIGLPSGAWIDLFPKAKSQEDMIPQ